MPRNDLTQTQIALTIGGKRWQYSTDYRLFVDYATIITANGEGILPFLHAQQLPACVESVTVLNELYFPPKPNARGSGGNNFVFKYDVLWELIYAAFVEKYGIDLYTTDLHFRKFQMLLNGLTGTYLNEVLSVWNMELSKCKGKELVYVQSIRAKYPLQPTASGQTAEQVEASAMAYIQKRRQEVLDHG